MPATAAGHPPAPVLAAYALGRLDAAAAQVVHTHLAGCPECRTVVETTPGDSLLALLREAVGTGTTPPLSQAGSVTRGTLPVPNPALDETALPAELRDHPRYRLLRKLGQGGMGAVYQAEHRLMERVVAVKVIAAGLVDSPEAAERFHREVKAAARLDHRNIVRAYDADRAGSAMLLAMEFVPGRTLADVVERKGPLPVDYACHCARQAAAGLQHAHERGMVHRDLKPHNLMLTDRGVVKVLDFGLAKLASERASRAGLTADDVVMGTPEYIAPEQARDTASADIRADIYSLGCTLFFLLTGRPPFAGETAIEVMTRHLTDPPPALTDLRPDAPAGLAALVGQMLAKDPADRPQTPREVADALAPFARASAPPAMTLAAAPGAAPPPTPPRRGRRWLVPAAVLALAAALWAGSAFRGAAPHQPAPPDPPPTAGGGAPEPASAPAGGPPPDWLAGATGKAPVPPAEQLAAAGDQLRAAYKAETAAGKPADKARVAKDLVRRSAEAGEAAARYAMLDLAAEWAAEAGDFATAFDACDRLGQSFLVDALRKKADALKAAPPVQASADATEALVEAALAAGFEALAADNYPAAGGLANVATPAAKRSGQAHWVYQAGFLAEECARGAAAYDRLRAVVANPHAGGDDPATNAAVGRYACFVKDDWDKGLPALARGSDPALRSLAEKELAIPLTAVDQFALGDAWLAASKAAVPDEADDYRRRCQYWYLKGLAQAPPAERAARARNVAPALAALPVRPVTLRIRVRDADFHGLRFSGDGITTTWNRYAPPTVQVNHVRWQASRAPGGGVKNSGRTRLFPSDVDLSLAEVTGLRVGRWGAVQVDGAPDHLDFNMAHDPAGACNYDFTVTVKPNGLDLPGRASPVWDVKYFALGGSPADPAAWDKAVQGTPLLRQTAGRLCFAFTQVTSPWGKRQERWVVPPKNIAVVASSDWDLPGGRYRVRAVADDGVRVFVDGKKSVDAWRDGAATEHTAEETLAAGAHRVRVEYYQTAGPARLEVSLRKADRD